MMRYGNTVSTQTLDSNTKKISMIYCFVNNTYHVYVECRVYVLFAKPDDFNITTCTYAHFYLRLTYFSDSFFDNNVKIKGTIVVPYGGERCWLKYKQTTPRITTRSLRYYKIIHFFWVCSVNAKFFRKNNDAKYVCIIISWNMTTK